MSPTPSLPPVRAVFRAAVETAAPRALGFGTKEWERAEALVEGQLARRPAEVRRQLAIFLRVLGLLPLFRFGRTFPRLDPERRLRVLRWLESSPVLLLRRGVWGVRTLAFLAVYGQGDVRGEIGYRADPRGWDARPGADTAAHREGGAP